MKPLTFALILSLCLLVGCGEQKPNTSGVSSADTAALLENARQLKEANRFTEALAILDKAKQASPKETKTYLMQAEIHAQGSHLSDALRAVQEAHNVAPNDPEVTLALLRYTPPYLPAKETEAVARIAVAQQPQSSEAHYYLGKAIANTGDTQRADKAKKAFEQSLKLAPANPLPLIELGKFALQADKPKEAITALEKAWELSELYRERGGMPFLELATLRRNIAFSLSQAYRRAGQETKAADFSAKTARYTQRLEEYQTLAARASANPPDEQARTKLVAIQQGGK
jgi:Tfp pilus assembly protein PilF